MCITALVAAVASHARPANGRSGDVLVGLQNGRGVGHPLFQGRCKGGRGAGGQSEGSGAKGAVCPPPPG